MDTVAVLNDQGRVMFSARVPPKTRRIDVAGGVTLDGAPVNRKVFKVSRSIPNLSIAADSFRCPELALKEYKGFSFWVQK